MRTALVMTLSLAAAAAAADRFPPADQLPARPELPDPLVMLDGRRVATPEQWHKERRPELKALFQHYMYGQLPPALPVTSTVEREDKAYFGGKATKRELRLSFGRADVPPLQLLLVVPNRRSGPAPVFVGLNFYGNHAVVSDPAVPLPAGWVPDRAVGAVKNRATEAGRGSQVDTWALEQSIDRGYAVATMYCGDVHPDRAGPPEGVRRLALQSGHAEPGPHDAGVIACWAWGVMRAVDHLVTDPDLDRTRIAVVGHSRLGKTALVAAAFDERIALAVPAQAGCGGTAPSRGTVGESVKQINDRFPHWFCGAFKEFNGRTDRLPFDQHCLVALCAPRPVLLPNATEDSWANPDGQFEVLRAAEPVYRLLGAGGLAAPDRPAVGALSAGVLGYHVRPGKHAMTREDWKVYLDFADGHFRKTNQ